MARAFSSEVDTGSREENASKQETRAFSSEVGTGSREENASKQETRVPFRFNRNGKGSSAIIALGGNVGDVRATFKKAIAEICRMAQAELLARSSDYGTPPWGDMQQARFVNACIEIQTTLAPLSLLSVLLTIERVFGRDRSRERRWGPRTLDLDLIAYDDISMAQPELTLPHPRLFDRAFVLVPLAEIAPDRLIAGRRVKAALAEIGSEGIERLRDRD